MPGRRMFCCIMLLVIVLVFMPQPATAAPGATDWGTAVRVVKTDNTELDLTGAGYKGTVCEFAYIQVTFTASEVDLAVGLNSGHNLADITVTGGGVDETSKFTPKLDNGKLKLQLNYPTARLQEGTLYRINIPAGTFIDSTGTIINNTLKDNFVTLMQNPARSDILVSTSPAMAADGVSEKTQRIVFTFVDNITITDTNKMAFHNTPVIFGADCDPNFDISAVGKQLILTAKNNGTVKDFVYYDITLEEGAVTLTGTSIANAVQTLNFSTDCMYSSVFPASRQTGVGLEPIINFTFKQPIKILNKDRITITAAGEPPVSCSIDDSDIKVVDGKGLVLDLKDGGNCLNRNTCYTVKLEAGAVQFVTPELENKEIIINFTTTSAGQQPIITAYSSDAAGTDNICTLTGTKLAPDGSIYIHFDRAIAWDREYTEPLEKAELYMLPAPSTTDYDPQGWSFDSTYIYDASGAISGQKAIPIKSMTITASNTICVKPLYPLLSLNCYRFYLERRVVEDLYGFNMEKDIDFNFWTMPTNNTTVAAWDGVNDILPGNVMSGSSQGTMTYTITGTPVYTSTIPLSLEADGEVIVKAGDAEALTRIKLTKKGETEELAFSSFKLEYYYEADSKHTRILIYFADGEVQTGEQYSLTIPADVFQTRGGIYLPALIVYFIPGTPVLSVYSVEPISLSTVAVAQQTSFQVKGYDLDSTIQKVVLTPMAGRCLDLNALTIEKEDLYLIDTNTLQVMLRGDNAAWLGREEASGTYMAEVWYGNVDAPQKAAAVGEPSLQIVARGIPTVLSYYPAPGAQYDEKALLPQVINGTTRYFLSVKWQDPDDRLDLNLEGNALSRLKTSSVYAAGGSQISMVDTDFIAWIENIADTVERNRYIDTYLYNLTTDTLYIPVRLLRAQTNYTVLLNEDIVMFTGGQGNILTSWSFSSVPVPSVMTVTPGSVVEDYTSRTAVYIEGSFFATAGVKVKFNNRYADTVEIVTVDGETHVKATLPVSSRLDPGVYNITVINDDNHQQTLYSAFSVVGGADISSPQDGQRTRSEERLGNVVEKVKTSETVLQLDRRYWDKNHLAIDLDELMGDKVLTRTISFEGRLGDSIGELITLSRWADITVYGLALDSTKSRDDISLQLGRVDGSRSSWLGNKLRGRVRLSDFIEVGGSNFRVDRVKINMPFSLSEGNNLKVLRYDDIRRNWLEVPFTVNRLEGTVLLNSTRPGIFVVVE